MSTPNPTRIEAVADAIKFTRDSEKAVKREIAKGFWQFDVSAQRRPKNHRK